MMESIIKIAEIWGVPTAIIAVLFIYIIFRDKRKAKQDVLDKEASQNREDKLFKILDDKDDEHRTEREAWSKQEQLRNDKFEKIITKQTEAYTRSAESNIEMKKVIVKLITDVSDLDKTIQVDIATRKAS